MNGKFCAESIKKHLTEGFDRLIFLDETDSTNDFCKREMPPCGTFIIAASQSGGKGRLGRKFESKEGGIFLSLVLQPKISLDRLMCITGMTAVAVMRAIEDATGVKCGVKWINDILLGGKKICGILAEAQFEGSAPKVVIGIGVNANNPASDFEWDTEGKAGSILTETGRPVDLPRLAAALIKRLDELSRDLEEGNVAPYVEAYRQSCTTLGREITLLRCGGSGGLLLSNERASGFAKDIDDAFGLVVEYQDGECETIRSGEVSVRGKMGEYK